MRISLQFSTTVQHPRTYPNISLTKRKLQEKQSKNCQSLVKHQKIATKIHIKKLFRQQFSAKSKHFSSNGADEDAPHPMQSPKEPHPALRPWASNFCYRSLIVVISSCFFFSLDSMVILFYFHFIFIYFRRRLTR